MIIKTKCKDSIIKLIGDKSEENEPKIIIIAIPRRMYFKSRIEINRDNSYTFIFDLRNLKNRSLVCFKDFNMQQIVATIIPSRLRQPKVFVHDFKGQSVNKLAKFYYKNLK